VRVATRDPDIGAAEQLLDEGQSDALRQGDGGSRVPHCVHTQVGQPGVGQDVRPFPPVSFGVNRPAVLMGEYMVRYCQSSAASARSFS
jgi:hypothetical protein